jgi:hypothetical protein
MLIDCATGSSPLLDWSIMSQGTYRPPDLTHYQDRRGYPCPRSHLNRNAIPMLGQPPASAVTVVSTVGIAARIAYVRAAASRWPSSRRPNSPTPCQNADPSPEQNSVCRSLPTDLQIFERSLIGLGFSGNPLFGALFQASCQLRLQVLVLIEKLSNRLFPKRSRGLQDQSRPTAHRASGLVLIVLAFDEIRQRGPQGLAIGAPTNGVSWKWPTRWP